MTATAKKRQNLYRIVAVGLMAALVYIGNFMEIRLNNDARVHLGNSMCLLAGLLFGGINGGLSSGIGGVLYDIAGWLPFMPAVELARGAAAGTGVGTASTAAAEENDEDQNDPQTAVAAPATIVTPHKTEPPNQSWRPLSDLSSSYAVRGRMCVSEADFRGW